MLLRNPFKNPTFHDIEFGLPEIVWKKTRVFLPWVPLSPKGGVAFFGMKVIRGDFEEHGTSYCIYFRPDEWTRLKLEGKL